MTGNKLSSCPEEWDLLASRPLRALSWSCVSGIKTAALHMFLVRGNHGGHFPSSHHRLVVLLQGRGCVTRARFGVSWHSQPSSVSPMEKGGGGRWDAGRWWEPAGHGRERECGKVGREIKRTENGRKKMSSVAHGGRYLRIFHSLWYLAWMYVMVLSPFDITGIGIWILMKV